MRLSHCFLSLLFFLVAVLSVLAASPQRQWSLSKGANMAEVGVDGLHLNQNSGNDTTSYATATAKLPLAAVPVWRVAFSVRFGQLRSAGAAVRLCRGTTVIAWVGADGWNKGLGVFIGDSSVFGQPADARWHQFVYASDGETLTIWLDGAQVAAGASEGIPDTITAGSWWDGKSAAGQQTEVWVKDIQEQAVIVPPPSSPAVVPTTVSPALPPMPDFRGVPLDRLVQDYNDALTRAEEACASKNNSSTNSHDYFEMQLRAQSDEDRATLGRDEKYCFNEELKYLAQQKQELRLALAMHQAILSDPRFPQLYHETRQCLPPEEVTLDIIEARQLRFIEKR